MKRIISTIALFCFAACLLAQQINKCEYFFDTDPGVGNGTAIAVTTADSIDLSSVIPINSLSNGFHKLGMRFRYTTGVWSLNEVRMFYVYGAPAAAATMVTKAEYFFDTDPGKGNGTALVITPGDSVLLNAVIATGSLTAGFHRVVTRFCDNKNVWSLNEARTVYVSAIPAAAATQVTKAEYFFDTDPGQGNATPAPVAAGDSVSIVTAIPATLPAGFHKLFFRFRDDKNKWSLNEARTFYINTPIAPANAQVVAAEYFFDGTDPGVGKATAILGFTPGDSTVINKIIVASGLTAGQTHKLTIRVKDSKNVWGLNETRAFDVCNAPAVASFTNTLYYNTVTLTNTSTNSYGFLWKFGDDSTSTLKNPVHTYAFGGVFKIMLIALNPCGNDTAYQTVNFNCGAPSSYFYTSVNQLDVTVTNAASGATTYSWDFGDGFTSTSSAPKHTYFATGTYTVCLTATNGCGTNTYCSNVSVTCTVPNAQFTSSLNGLTAVFNNQSTSAANVNWYFGDGGISNQQSPTYTYNNAGTYIVKLVVSNSCGKDSTTQTLPLVCTLPVPAFDFNPDGLTIEFENNSTSATSYKWNFGDGKTATLKNPTHKYATTGNYNVCLVATNGCGKDSICTMIKACTQPTADFISSDSLLYINLVNASLNGETYYWTFGDGYASNVFNPSHKYTNKGTYNVCLNVTNSCGSDKICRNVTTSCAPFGAPPICLVTVDSVGDHNVIYWDKTSYKNTAVDSFIVYREVSTGIYKPIAFRAIEDSSYFIDTLATKYGPLLANGDPRKSTYRYKIQFKDTCGGYSPLSHYHNTIYILYAGNGQFTWNPGYTIEAGANPVNNYLLLRDDSTTGSWKVVASTAGTANTLVDNNFAKYKKGSWRVGTQWAISCTPTFNVQTKGGEGMQVFTTKTLNTTRSNIKNNLPVGVGIKEQEAANALVRVYPNPANDNLNIEWPEAVAVDQPCVAVHNYLGMEIMKYTPVKNQQKITVNISTLAAGLYFVEVKSNNYRFVKKVVVE